MAWVVVHRIALGHFRLGNCLSTARLKDGYYTNIFFPLSVASLVRLFLSSFFLLFFLSPLFSCFLFFLCASFLLLRILSFSFSSLPFRPFFRDGEGCSCLHLAAQFGHTSIVAYLVARGQDVDMQDRNGMTALMWAAYRVFA